MGFAREGAKVAICARGEAALNEAAAAIRKQTGGEVLAMVADMAKPDDIKKFVNESAEHFGRFDVIVNNAGGPPPGEFMKFTDEDWNNAYNLSFMSTMRMTREAVPHMRKVGGGKVINITSYSVKEPITGLVLSNAVRSAVIGLAKTLSRELARDNILFNNVCPGRIDTERAQKLNKAQRRPGGPTGGRNQQRDGGGSAAWALRHGGRSRRFDRVSRLGSRELHYRNDDRESMAACR